MNTERIDNVEKYYKPIERIEKLDSITFWVSAVLSIVVLHEDKIPWVQLQRIPSILFVVLVIVHLVLSLYLQFYLMPTAERIRRRQLLSDAFGVPLTSERTKNYYNNSLMPSMAKLGANVFENSLFAKTTCTKMVDRERVKVLLYFLTWVIAATWRSTDLGLLVIITQTLFSSEIIEKWLRLEILRHSNESIYNEFYSDFLHNLDFDSPKGIASTLDKFASYESVKAMTRIKQSSSIFKDINPSTSIEWASLCEQLGMDSIQE